MLKNRGHLPYNYIGELLLLPTKFHKNESYMEKTQYFSEASNIARLHINIDTSKEKVINVHIKDRTFIHFKACAEVFFQKNIDDPSMILMLLMVCT